MSIAEIIKTVDGNMRPCWNVLSKEWGNSGYKYTYEDACQWALQHGLNLPHQKISVLKETNVRSSAHTGATVNIINDAMVIRELKHLLILVLSDWWPLVHDRACRETVRAQGKRIRTAIDLNPQDPWIKCSDELPPDKTPVLIVHKGVVRIGHLDWDIGDVHASYQPFRYWDDPNDDGQDWEWDDVTHWLPLPVYNKPVV